MEKWGVLVRAALAALVALPATGCAFSNYQSAKMVPPGNTSLGAAITSYGSQGDTSADEEAFELMGSHGLSDRLEIGGKFAWFLVEDADTFNFLVVPKYSIKPGVLAITIPAGLLLATGEGESDNAWMLMPGLIFTHQLHEYFELNLSGKPAIFFEDDFSDNNVAVAGNIGIRLTPPGQRWSLFPEIGFMWDDDFDDETDYVLQLGFAFHFEIGPTAPASPATPAPAPP